MLLYTKKQKQQTIKAFEWNTSHAIKCSVFVCTICRVMDCRGGSRLLAFVLVGSGFLMAGGSQPSSNTGVNVGISSSSSGHLVLHQTHRNMMSNTESSLCLMCVCVCLMESRWWRGYWCFTWGCSRRLPATATDDPPPPWPPHWGREYTPAQREEPR